jgi:hypothetical protein
MARNQHLDAVSAAEERRHEVLPVPHADDDRQVGLDRFVKIRRFEDEAVRPPHQPQEFGREDADCLLDGWRLRKAPGGKHAKRSAPR